MSNNLDTRMQSQLRDFVRRIQNIKKEQADLSEDLKNIYKEVAYSGFDVKVMREVIKRLDQKVKEEEGYKEEMVNLYMNTINGASLDLSKEYVSEVSDDIE